MKPRLILHIGVHKTGTTAIQHALHRSRTSLLEAGVLVPRIDRDPWPDLPKHCSVYAAAAGGDPLRAQLERDALVKEFEACGAHTLLITEEGLSEPDRAIVDFFVPWRDRFDIEVICYLRRPDLLVEALYNQFVRESQRHEARPILMFARAPVVRARLDFAAMLAPWRELAARMHVMNFDQARAGDGLLQSFASAAGLPALSASEDMVNPSVDMRLVVMLTQLNRQRIRYSLGALSTASHTLMLQGRFPPLRHALGSDERARMLADLAPSLARLAREFDIVFDDQRPMNEPANAMECVDPVFAMEIAAHLSLR